LLDPPRPIAPATSQTSRVPVVESYSDVAVRPQPPSGVILFAPCSFNSLNKLAHGTPIILRYPWLQKR